MREDVSDNTLLLDLAEAAEKLRCCGRTVRRFIANGELPYIDVGRGHSRARMKIHPADLASFIESRRRFECPSTSRRKARSTRMTSNSTGSDFMARPSVDQNAKQNSLKRNVA